MSTSTPASASDSIGILGDPALADQLARCGLTVVSDPDVAQAARLVTQSPPPVTLVVDGPGPGAPGDTEGGTGVETTDTSKPLLVS